MKTPDEIKKGMTCCLTRWEGDYLASCHTDCPYRSEGIWCRNVLMADIKAWNKRIESRLAQVERERDAALSEWKRTKMDSEGMCWICKHWLITSTGIHRCVSPDPCDEGENWEWRGVCDENTKDGKEGKA